MDNLDRTLRARKYTNNHYLWLSLLRYLNSTKSGYTKDEIVNPACAMVDSCNENDLTKFPGRKKTQPHFVKIIRIRSYSGPHFSAFGLNTGRYAVPTFVSQLFPYNHFIISSSSTENVGYLIIWEKCYKEFLGWNYLYPIQIFSSRDAFN